MAQPKMKIYDITQEIREDMPVYKNKLEKKPKINLISYKDKGIQESRFCLDSHTGTHVDAPLHMIKNGKTVLDLPLDSFFSKAIVLDFTNVDKITSKDLEKHEIEENYFILLKTRNSFDKNFNFNFVYLDATAAKYLADKKVKGVAIDALGIERNQPNHETHKILMKANIIILEGINLSKIKPGRYEFIFLPLKIKADASPVRALLIER